MPATGMGWCAILLFAALALPIAYLGRDEGSGFILMTSPTFGHGSNSLLGYSWILADKPFHKENVQFLRQVSFFCGVRTALGIYAVRPLYAFVAAHLQPLFGVVGSLLAVNVLCWAVAAGVSWRFVRSLFGDIAGLAAVAMVACGSGMVFHVGDYSAHLMAFTVYYAGLLVLYESRVWCERRPLGTHLTIGICLAFACLQYNTGISLVAGYVVVSHAHNRSHHLLAAAAVAVSAQRLWPPLLNLMDRVFRDSPGVRDYYVTEAEYLTMSLAAWSGVLTAGADAFFRLLVSRVSEFRFFDSPPLVAIGLVSLLWVPRRVRPFFLVFVAMPLGAGLAFANRAAARGYLVYGCTLLIYAAIAGLLARFCRRGGAIRTCAVVAFVVVIVAQIAWTTAHLHGHFGPVKSYLLGFGLRSALYSEPRPTVLSLTGAEPTPQLFGGRADLTAAGLSVAAAATPGRPSFRRALAARSMFYVLAGALVLLAVRPTARAPSFVVFLLIAFGSTWLSVLTYQSSPVVTPVDRAINLAPAERVRYEIDVSQPFVRELRVQVQPEDTLEVGLYASGAADARASIGERTWALRLPEAAIPVDEALAAFEGSRRLSIDVVARQPVFVRGWQRVGLPGRVLESPMREGALVLPAVELRLRSSTGALKLAGF